MQLEHLVIYDKNFIDQLINFRPNETKLGERMQLCFAPQNWKEELKASEAMFVLIGVPEDIGVQGNLGRAGAEESWECALSSILNLQNNRFLNGSDLFLLGHLNFRPIREETEAISADNNQGLKQLRDKVARIDEHVSILIEAVVRAGKIPIVIGGGHNNAYGCIKGAAVGKGEAINVVNLDPHLDYRRKEGRHSGNAFRYAKEEGHLDYYFVVGAHESYNAENIYHEFELDQFLHVTTFEELFIRHQKDLNLVLKNIANRWHREFTGIEIDLDAIAGMPVSAYSPSGFTVEDVRRYVHYCGKHLAPAYMHICEGAPALGDSNARTQVGKTIAYLIADFIKSVKSA